MSKQFYSLSVDQLVRETDDTVSIHFNIPNDLKSAFSYTQGQYLTLKFQIGGNEVRRAYSMSSSPLEDHIAVTVKRVEGGLVSNFINDKLEVGQQIEVMPPDGRFFTDLNEDHRKTYYMFGAGSGITPLISIIKTIVEKEPQSTVFLLYGNRNEESIIFKEQLGQIQKRYEGQFFVEHILSQPKRERSRGLAGFFSKGSLQWEGRVGRIDKKQVNRFLEENNARYKEVEYFICGPGNMIDSVESALLDAEIDKKKIHIERFSSSVPGDKPNVTGASSAQVKVHLNEEEISIEVPADKTILDALLDNKYDPPYSCTSGACSTCMAKLINGEVKMEVYYAIDDEEVAQGYILTCQAHPTTEKVELTFDI